MDVLAIPVPSGKGASELRPLEPVEHHLDDQLLKLVGDDGHLAAGVGVGATGADVAAASIVTGAGDSGSPHRPHRSIPASR